MYFLKQYRFALLFLAVLVFCSVMVIHQLSARQSKHVDYREAFILLYTKGYTNEATLLYRQLLKDFEKLPDKALYEDFQRTLSVIDASSSNVDNLIYKYHWTVSKEMDRRSESNLMRALNLAESLK